MTQSERVLRLLRTRRQEGVNTADLLGPTVDGGKPIVRLAARIFDLQQRGYSIRSERRTNGTHSYFLEREPAESNAICADSERNLSEICADSERNSCAIPAQSWHDDALFDASVLTSRGDYRDVP